MIQLHLLRLFISAALFFLICFTATWVINPQSLVSFVGPSAAFISGLLLIWHVTPIIAVIIVSPVVAWSLKQHFSLDADLAIMLIATLAITLQAVWTKQLVFRFIHYKKWLTSRKYLFFFLLRIGPVASLVSASAVLVIAMLDNQVINGSFLYTFINTWSVSMLVAVFFTPLILLAKNAEQIKLTKRIFFAFTSVLSGFAILLLFKTSQHEQQHHRQEVFKASGVEIKRLIDAELKTITNKVKSLSAFFKASEHISPAEFSIFSESVFEGHSSIRVLEWAPLITHAERKQFENQTSHVLAKPYAIKEHSRNGQLVPAKEQELYAPLFYMFPKQNNQVALGLDLYSNPEYILSMQSMINSKKVIASAPITLIQDELAKPAILFGTAIYLPEKSIQGNAETQQNKLVLPTDGELIGFVIAVVDIERFFQRLAKQKQQQVSIYIQDVAGAEPITFFGEPLAKANRHSERIEIPVFSRVWQVSLVETHPWFSQPKSWQAWAVLVGGTLGSLVFQMLVLMMAAYSRELSSKIEIKTRAIRLAKESSEQKSLAKSQFLHTLNKELCTPLLAIKAFVEQLKQKGINNSQVFGISHAGDNVTLLIDTMMDLSDIESGKIIIKEDCFDFHGFLQRTESILKACTTYEGKSIFFLIDESVPHYINSDELYIQKLLNALIESAHQLFKTDDLRLSIKLHKHNLADASIFFTLSPQNAIIGESNTAIVNPQVHTETNTDSTAMTMAIKYSQLLRGDVNLGALSSGEGVLSASVRVVIPSLEEQ